MFLTDWGGPIGLEFARAYPERVDRKMIAYTWCWPADADPHFKRFCFLMRSRVRQFMIKRMNCFVNKVVPKAIGNKAVITPEMMHHYRSSLPNPYSRNACAALPVHIIGACDWLDQIWADRDKFVTKPSLVFWGMKDIAFRRKELEHWQQNLTDCQFHEFKDCGHFLAEEAPDRRLPMLRSFLARA